MKSVRLNPEQGWTVAAGFLVIVFLVLSWFAFFPIEPKTDERADESALNRDLLRAEEEKRQSLARVDEAEMRIAALTWPQTIDEISPSALGRVGELARQAGVKVTSFRPQRTQDDTDVPAIPFLVTVEGEYPRVLTLLRLLESETTRLAVTLVQIAAADGATDRVNTTYGITAFLTPEEIQKSLEQRQPAALDDGDQYAEEVRHDG